MINKSICRKFAVKGQRINGLTFDNYVEKVDNIGQRIENPAHFRASVRHTCELAIGTIKDNHELQKHACPCNFGIASTGKQDTRRDAADQREQGDHIWRHSQCVEEFCGGEGKRSVEKLVDKLFRFRRF